MTLMSNAMHRAGLAGVPRRTAEPEYGQVTYEGVVGSIGEMRLQIAIGGTLLTISLALFLYVVVTTWLSSRSQQLRVNGSLPEPLSPAENGPRILDNLKLWVVIAVLLVALAYGFPIYSMVADGALNPGIPAVPMWL
jgi:cytochrome c oxidase subunit 1